MWGSNLHGELGTNVSRDEIVPKPTLMKNIGKLSRVECGGRHNLSIDRSSFFLFYLFYFYLFYLFLFIFLF